MKCSVDVCSDAIGFIVAAVVSGNADVGICCGAPSAEGITPEPVATSRVVVVVPQGHELSGKPLIKAIDLHQQKVISVPPHLALRVKLEEMLRDCESRPLVVAESSTPGLAIELCQKGLGVALVHSFPATCRRYGGVVFKPLDPAIEEPVYLVWRKHATRSEFARRFAGRPS
jgi:DNA-binding transcriptional LysR family regulator